MLRLSISSGYKTVDDSWLNHEENPKGRYATWFNPNLFSLALTKLLDELGVKIYFESQVSEVLVKDNKIKSIDIYTIEGKITLEGKSFVDATGSAYLFKQAGLKTINGTNYLTYATTTYQYGLDKPVFHYTGATLSGENQPKEARIYKDASQKDVNEYQVLGQKLCLKEYEDGIIKDVSILPMMSQFRRISTIFGDYQLSKNDLYKHHDDSVGTIGVFDKPKELYEIPMGCLYNSKIKNLFAAGRIISCLDNDAWEVTRVIPVCAFTGEVAGYMCYLYNKDESVSIQKLQNILKNKGINIHFDDTLIM